MTMQNRVKSLFALATVAMATLAFTATSNAASIYSEDFETSSVTAGGFNTAAGWASTDFTSASSLNELHAGTYGTHLSEIDNAFGVIFTATLTADLGINFADNTDYTFSFDQFQRSDQGAGGPVTAQIQTVGGTVLATDDFAAVSGTTATDIANRSVSFSTIGGLEVGQEVRLVFISATGSAAQVGIDNIVLDETANAVPEPGSITLALLSLSALGLMAIRRRRNRR